MIRHQPRSTRTDTLFPYSTLFRSDRTADVVGLDTMAHVIKTMADTLPDDPWHKYFKSPKWLAALVEKGAPGQKTGAGIFRKVGKDIMVLDPEKQDYRPADRKAADEVGEILKTKDPVAKFGALPESGPPQEQFLWAVFQIGRAHV